MAKQKLDQYYGKLTPAQIAVGINAARINARRLAEDAKTLFEAKRLPSAASLAILSIEESGKSTIIRQLAIAESEEEIRNCWKDYRSHAKKNVLALLPQIVKDGARHLSDFAPLFNTDAEHPFLVDMVKQISFYTDCLGKAHWSVPLDVIDENLAHYLVFTATLLSEHDHEITPREIELWIKYMKPVKHKDMMANKIALRNWWTAMQAEGIAKPGENEMEKFVFGTTERGDN